MYTGRGGRGLSHVYDLERFGLVPQGMIGVHNELGIPDGMTEAWDAPATYTSRRSGDMDIVRMEFHRRGENASMEWEIDRRRGGQVVRSTVYRNGSPAYWSVTGVAQRGGIWYPKRVEFYTAEMEHTPYMVVDVHEASFDAPWHRRESFTPDDIGVGFGHNILFGGDVPGAVPGYDGMYCWDGAGLITKDESMYLIYLFGVDPDPRFVEGLSRPGTGRTPESYAAKIDAARASPAVVDRLLAKYEADYGVAFDRSAFGSLSATPKHDAEDEWDRYVRTFLERHKLGDKASARANRLLNHCKKLRDWHRFRARNALAKAREKNDRRGIDKVEAPVRRIFERMLRPGLERLAKWDKQ